MKKSILVLLLLTSVSFSQGLQKKHLFYNSFYDASSECAYAEAGLFGEFYGASAYEYFRISGNYSISKITLNAAALVLENNSPSYFSLGGRYNYDLDKFCIAAGVYYEFRDPFTFSSFYEGYLDEIVSVFSAARYYLNDDIAFSGSLRLQYYNPFQKESGYYADKQVILNLGALVSLSSSLTLMAEIGQRWNGNLLFGGGLDYIISDNFSISGAFFANGEIEVSLFAGLSYNF